MIIHGKFVPPRGITAGLLAATVWLASCACAKKNPAAHKEKSATVNSLQTIIDDMTLPHEGHPHGVPLNYDWAVQPRVGMGTDPGAFRAMTAWGQIYEDASGNPAVNSRVQIRNMRSYMLSMRDGQWHLLQSSRGVEGAAYREDFAGDVNKPPDLRLEPDSSVSVTAGGGYNYHFWPSTGRAAMDPLDVAGIFTTVQARLITADTAVADDRAAARYLLSMGGDYWLSLSAQWDNFKTNGDIGIGRFKYVRMEWEAFNMTSLPADSLRRNPPPME
jgi:hypothetical protein